MWTKALDDNFKNTSTIINSNSAHLYVWRQTTNKQTNKQQTCVQQVVCYDFKSQHDVMWIFTLVVLWSRRGESDACMVL